VQVFVLILSKHAKDVNLLFKCVLNMEPELFEQREGINICYVIVLETTVLWRCFKVRYGLSLKCTSVV
jgi:hypothetical protein